MVACRRSGRRSGTRAGGSLSTFLAPLLVAVLAGAPTAPEPSTPEPTPWLLRAHVRAGAPVAFEDGMELGAGLGARRQLLWPETYVGARLSWSIANEANRDWTLVHHAIATTIGVGGELHWQGARVWLEGGGGAMALIEQRRRHQFERLERLGVDGREGGSYSLGPRFYLEAGVAVGFYGAWSMVVAGGPLLDAHRVQGVRGWRMGWTGQAGVARAF